MGANLRFTKGHRQKSEFTGTERLNYSKDRFVSFYTQATAQLACPFIPLWGQAQGV